MSVRAKFYCSGKRENASMGHGAHKTSTIVLHPVTSGSEENESFYNYTPSGSIELSVVLPEVADQFELGKCYYIDFTPAE